MKTIIAAILIFASSLTAAEVRWQSATTGTELRAELRQPATKPSGAVATVVYLKNLAIPRIGQESDEAIVGDFAKQGMLVLVLDYAKDAKAVSPALNADLLKLRTDIADAKKKNFLLDQNVDVNHLFIVPEGFRLKRDVEFARDGERVLGMDVIYPAKAKEKVPALMEITCDNNDRMGSFSLLFCHDTLFEGAALAGFASAMIDHPVPPPYKGIDDPMPQCVDRLKAAAKTLRRLSGEIGTSDKIGVMGFSRGGPVGALLATTGEVQAALVHGGRYDYLKLATDDSMYKRFEKAWGPRETNQEKWAVHGAAYFLSKRTPPMFLNTSDAESKEYRDQLALFDRELTDAGIEHVYQVDQDGRGHRVSTDPATLAKIYSFFHQHLDH